jgi:hypothetical protein
MKKMQRRVLKNLIVLIMLFITALQTTSAQISSFRLKTADSLFHAKQYTQSFEHYQTILQQKEYTPAMLLKMAYIQEGLNNIGQAMYYLNLYYLATNDKSVLDKMEELANKFNLEGYETTDAVRARVFYHDHFQEISFALAALAVFFLSIIFYTRIRLKRTPIAGPIALSAFLILFFIHLNFGEPAHTGIISSSKTYIMNGPSAGASVIEITGDGHRVEILGEKDVWMKVKWNDDVAYIRNNSLRPVKL